MGKLPCYWDRTSTYTVSLPGWESATRRDLKPRAFSITDSGQESLSAGCRGICKAVSKTALRSMEGLPSICLA